MRKLIVLCGFVLALVCAASAAQEGIASFFQYSGYHGLIAAHRSLPKGSQARVVNLDNGRSVVVTIVDRGPFIPGRIVDVSPEAAVALGFRQAGLAHVRVDPIAPEAPNSAPPAKEQVAAAAPDEICKGDADRLESLRSNPTSGEIARLQKELSCEKLRPQLMALVQSSPSATAPDSSAFNQAKTAPSPAVKNASAAHVKERAPSRLIRTRFAAAWRHFHVRRYASGCAASCSWRGQEKLMLASN